MSALLFTAASAWLGAAVFTALQKPRPIMLHAAEQNRGGELEGIILRREEAIGTVPPGAREHQRLSPGEHSEQSAIFSSFCDGYEYLSPAMADKLEPEMLKELMSKPKKAEGSAKLVYGFDFFYAAYYHGSEDIEPGPCRVRFEGTEQSMRAELVSLSRDAEGCAVVLRLLLCPECIDLRFCKAELEY